MMSTESATGRTNVGKGDKKRLRESGLQTEDDSSECDGYWAIPLFICNPPIEGRGLLEEGRGFEGRGFLERGFETVELQEWGRGGLESWKIILKA